MPNTNLLGSFGDVSNSSLMFRNKIINGNFDIWQRGTSQTSSGYGSDDRWQNQHLGSTKTASRQTFTLGQTDVPGNPTYFARTAVTSVAGASNYVIKQQIIESATTFSGQAVTLSFWAKADAAKNIAIEFAQYFGTGGSPSAQVSSIGVTTCALTTTWQKITVTTTIPSISGKTLGTNNDHGLVLNFWLDAGSTYNSRTNSLGQQSGTFDIAQVQLEAGTVATPFEQRPVGLELSLCQRYYEVLLPRGGAYTSVGSGSVVGTTACYIYVPFATEKRTTGYTLDIAAGSTFEFTAGGTYSSMALTTPNSTRMVGLLITISGGTNGQSISLRAANNTASQIAITNEL